MRASIVITPTEGSGARSTLMKSLDIEGDELPCAGDPYLVPGLSRELEVLRVIGTNVPEPEIHFAGALAHDEAFRLMSMGWREV